MPKLHSYVSKKLCLGRNLLSFEYIAQHLSKVIYIALIKPYDEFQDIFEPLLKYPLNKHDYFMKSLLTTLFITFLLILNSPASAEEEPLKPADLEIGEEINETCAGCHGEFAEGGKDGEYPRLAGLPASYIKNQLHLFRDRIRPNIPMLEYLDKGQMPEQDIIDVSAYLASIQLVTKLPPLVEDENFDAYERMNMTRKLLNIPIIEGDLKAGKKLYKKECRSCHGNKGEGKEKKGAPMLTGQYTQYLQRQVKLFINKKRIHDLEEPEEEILADFEEQELNDIFAYLTTLDDE